MAAADSDRQPADSREEIYRRFVDYASGENTADSFFEENDLIDVFDFASDTNDDFARLEVLQYAARMYPDCTPINERKAFYYLELGLTDPARGIALTLPADSVLRTLLLLRTDTPATDEARRILDRLVDSTDDFEDEWLIRLADTAQELGLTDWLFEAKPRICKKATYPQTLIYDMVNIADDAAEYEQATDLAEELTSLEPFSSDFWEMLAREANHLSDYEKALNAVEYALAINPDSPVALTYKAQALSGLNRTTQEILEPLDRVIQLSPDAPDPIVIKASILEASGYRLQAIDTLEAFRRKHPDSADVILTLIKFADGNVSKSIVDDYFEAKALTVHECIEQAQSLMFESRYGAAAAILLAMTRRLKTRSEELTMTALYRAGFYSQAIEYFETPGELDLYVARDPVSVLIYVASRIRNANTDGLSEKVAELIDALDTESDFQKKMPNSFTTNLAAESAVKRLRKVLTSLTEGVIPEPESII